MKLLGYENGENSLLLLTDAGRIKLEPVTPQIVRVVYTPHETFCTTPSLMMLPRGDAPVPTWCLDEDEQTLQMKTAYLQVVIQKATCAFTWMDDAGQLLSVNQSAAAKQLKPMETTRPDLIWSFRLGKPSMGWASTKKAF